MTGLRCNVSSCRNNRMKTKKIDKDITYHAFPKDPVIRNAWIERCNRPGEWNPKTCHVCSVHFRPDDYKRDLQAELLNLKPKRKLKQDAIPTLHLNFKDTWDSVKNEPPLVQGEGPNEIFLVDMEDIKMKESGKIDENEILIKTESEELQEDDPLKVTESSNNKTVLSCRLEDDLTYMYEVLMKRYSAVVQQNVVLRKNLKESESLRKKETKRIKQLEKEVTRLMKRPYNRRKINQKQPCSCCSNQI